MKCSNVLHFLRFFTVCQRTRLGVLECSQLWQNSVLEGCINRSKSAYPDEMKQYAAFHHVIHCLPKFTVYKKLRRVNLSPYMMSSFLKA